MQILISNDTQQCQSPNPASLSLGHVRYTCAWKRDIIDQEPDGLLQLLHYKSQCRPGTKVPARAAIVEFLRRETDAEANSGKSKSQVVCFNVSPVKKPETHANWYYTQVSLSPIRDH